MKLYLSSYRFGVHPEKLKALLGVNSRVAIIMNAGDHHSSYEERKSKLEEQLKDLQELGIEGVELDLRNFYDPATLKAELKKYNGVWIRGGNSFLLRRAMYDSGFDVIIKELLADEKFVYAGYSAAIVVAGKTMKGLELVDDASAVQSIYNKEIIWEGLGLVDYSITPHYKSDHPESAAVEDVVSYFIENNIPYKALRDGEVIVVNEGKEELLK